MNVHLSWPGSLPGGRIDPTRARQVRYSLRPRPGDTRSCPSHRRSCTRVPGTRFHRRCPLSADTGCETPSRTAFADSRRCRRDRGFECGDTNRIADLQIRRFGRFDVGMRFDEPTPGFDRTGLLEGAFRPLNGEPDHDVIERRIATIPRSDYRHIPVIQRRLSGPSRASTGSDRRTIYPFGTAKRRYTYRFVVPSPLRVVVDNANSVAGAGKY